MTSRLTFTPLLIGGLLVISSMAVRPAAAQERPRLDLSGGYMTVNGAQHGWHGQFGSQVSSSRWTVFGQMDDASGPDHYDTSTSYRDKTVSIGLRQSWEPARGILPFWQLSGGVLSSTANYGRSSYTNQTFVIQPGGGVSVMVTPRFGVRLTSELQAGDSQVISLMHRFTAGAVVRLGR